MTTEKNREHITNIVGIFVIIALIWVGVFGMKLLSELPKSQTVIITCNDLTEEGKELILVNKDVCKENR